MASQFPSKASPRSSPLALNMALPELPPVMSLLEIKQTFISPFSSAYLPKSPEERRDSNSGCTSKSTSPAWALTSPEYLSRWYNNHIPLRRRGHNRRQCQNSNAWWSCVGIEVTGCVHTSHGRVEQTFIPLDFTGSLLYLHIHLE